MTQVTAMFVMFILYGVLPVAGLYLGYRGIKKMTAPKMLEYKAMPKLGYIPEKSLPVEVKTALDQINEKGEKLRVIYGDTNNDGKIDDKDTVNETYIMIQNLMDRHVPLAVADYRRLYDLDVGDGALADTTKIKHSNVTGKEALLDVLRTINTQFDDLLNASYHQDGQKLLATNRYLQKRFNNPATTEMQKLDNNISSISTTDTTTSANTKVEIKAIENPTGATDKSVSAEDIKL